MSKFDDLANASDAVMNAYISVTQGRETVDEAGAIRTQFRRLLWELEDEHKALLDDQEELVRVKAELAAIRALEPVAWHAEDHLTDRSAHYRRMKMDHTTPEKLGDFLAMAQGRADYVVNVICTTGSEYGELMTICASEEAVYITREQAKAFFGLVDPPPITGDDDDRRTD